MPQDDPTPALQIESAKVAAALELMDRGELDVVGFEVAGDRVIFIRRADMEAAVRARLVAGAAVAIVTLAEVKAIQACDTPALQAIAELLAIKSAGGVQPTMN
jgi:hypothetical protein